MAREGWPNQTNSHNSLVEPKAARHGRAHQGNRRGSGQHNLTSRSTWEDTPCPQPLPRAARLLPSRVALESLATNDAATRLRPRREW
eukprot:6308344-Alexandrium_andersonii.AAC.1